MTETAKPITEAAKPIPDLVFCDCETTGLDESTHEIVEIAVVRMNPMTLELVGKGHWYAQPVRAVNEEAAKINGYSPELWREHGAVLMQEILPALDPLLAGATPAGQNPGFDQRFIKEAYARADRPMPKMDYHLIDVAVLAWPMQLAGLIPGVSQKHTAKFFRLGEQTHTALSDVMQCIAIYVDLMHFYETRLRVATGAPGRAELQRPYPDWMTRPALHALRTSEP